MEKNNIKVVTGKIWLRNAALYEPRKYNEASEAKYSTVVIIPREEIQTLKAIKIAVQEAIKIGQQKFNNKSFGETLVTPLRNGNYSSSLDIIYKDAYYLNASTYYKPDVVDVNNNPLPAHFVVNGRCARVSLLFQPYSKDGKDFVSCTLLNVQLLKERFDPSKFLPKAADDFNLM